jgi:hypothetical protein
VAKSSHSTKVKIPVVTPLSVVTNLPRTSTPAYKYVQSRSHGENAHSQAPRKPTPLRRMPRYLNLAGTSPTKATSSMSRKKSHRGSFVWFVDAAPQTCPVRSRWRVSQENNPDQQ